MGPEQIQLESQENFLSIGATGPRAREPKEAHQGNPVSPKQVGVAPGGPSWPEDGHSGHSQGPCRQLTRGRRKKDAEACGEEAEGKGRAGPVWRHKG